MDTLSDILKKAREKYPALDRRMHEARAVQRWEKAVGPIIAKHAQALRVKDGVLWVEVDHPIWKSELHHRKAQILEILNERIQKDASADSASMVSDLFLVDRR